MGRSSLLALVLVTTPLHSAAAGGFAVPPPNHLFQLEKQNRSHPWLRIAADSVRYTLKVRHLDARGLRGFTAPEGVAPAPDLLTWREIERIDEVVTGAHAWAVTGAIAIGLGSAGLGNALGAPDGTGGNLALVGFLAGGAAGGWLGARFGERFQHERNWYVADTLPPEAALATATPDDRASTLVVPPGDVSTPAAERGLGASHDAIQVAGRIGRDDVVRVIGSFGQFQGFAGVAGPEGLEGLSIDPHAHGPWAATPPEHITWGSIDQVQMRGGSALRGAVIGAAAFGAVGALVGLAAVTALGNGIDPTPIEGALVGAAITAPVGAIVGAGLGALARRWVVVYQRLR